VRGWALVAPVVLAAASAPANAADACAGQMPPALVARFAKTHPGWRMPVENDNLAEDIAAARARGHSGCLGVAAGDYDGDGRLDRALMLVAPDGARWQLVVALDRPRGWKVEALLPAADGRTGMYVDTGAAGHFVQQGSYDERRGPPWLQRMSCGRQVVLFGGIERSETVACRARGRWWFVHTAD
jgi:hypothetical protein